MTTSITCQKCGKKLTVPDSAAGKRGKCPACGCVVLTDAKVSPGDHPQIQEWFTQEKDRQQKNGRDAAAEVEDQQRQEYVTQSALKQKLELPAWDRNRVPFLPFDGTVNFFQFVAAMIAALAAILICISFAVDSPAFQTAVVCVLGVASIVSAIAMLLVVRVLVDVARSLRKQIPSDQK